MELYQKYRPKSLEQFVGQNNITKRLSIIMSRPDFDRDCFWFQGPTGTGKTSLAWIIARQLAGNDFNIIEYNGKDINKGAMQDIERNIRYCPMFDGFKVYIINESHNMTAGAIQSWLTLLEDLPPKTLIIFTTHMNLETDLFGEHAGPFASRLKVFNFSSQGLCQLFAERAHQIAEKEGLNGQPLQKYVRLVQQCHNNFRMVLQRVGSAEML